MTEPVFLHIIPFAQLGGTEKDCLYFIEANKEHQHLVYVLDKDDIMVQQWADTGAVIKVLDILKLKDKDFHTILFDYVKDLDIIAILVWSTIKLPLVRYALRQKQCKLAVHVGNPSQLGFVSTLKQIIYHVYFRSEIETCLFSCSEYVKKSLVINPFYNKFHLEVILNPVRLLESNPYIVRHIDIDSDIIIGMTARLDPIKDHKTLIKAFSEIVKIYKNAKLWLLGDGVLRNDLEQLVIKLGINDNVVFLGRVENVYEMLQKMDIFVYSTTLKEGLGNAVSEAMANGLPCIISDLPMMHEIAGEDGCAVYFEKHNYEALYKAIISLIENREFRNSLSQKSFSRSQIAFSKERYSLDRFEFLKNK